VDQTAPASRALTCSLPEGEDRGEGGESGLVFAGPHSGELKNWGKRTYEPRGALGTEGELFSHDLTGGTPGEEIPDWGRAKARGPLDCLKWGRSQDWIEKLSPREMGREKDIDEKENAGGGGDELCERGGKRISGVERQTPGNRRTEKSQAALVVPRPGTSN